MIQITSLKQFDKAKARAAAGKLTVAPSSLLRQYRVTNEEKGVTYRVDFYKTRDGRKFATCECAGGQAGFICKHMGKAIPMHLEIMLQLERGGERNAEAAPFFTPNPAFDAAAHSEYPGEWHDGVGPDLDVANWQ